MFSWKSLLETVIAALIVNQIKNRLDSWKYPGGSGGTGALEITKKLSNDLIFFFGLLLLKVLLKNTVQIKTNLYAFCSSTLPQLFQWGKEELRKEMNKESIEDKFEKQDIFLNINPI
ncbi:hypothetical protein BpHYR1_013535 [Brachionus plicatilis]|uniref:Uncharacterized protein n=1 Tax=Brachionus plicatilis TaxID=10195 RepID=A0A3M7SI79_BRAPC|nr:hypothetical protein BpHYR1_013535 [Brachionus plicatilis]